MTVGTDKSTDESHVRIDSNYSIHKAVVQVMATGSTDTGAGNGT